MRIQYSEVRVFCLLLIMGLTAGLALAQYEVKSLDLDEKPFPWPEGKICAISLTFDDARLSQIDSGIPLLDRYDIKATFYISPDDLKKRLDGWKKAVANGHEIGNHTMNHPCTGNYAFARHKALEDYSLKKMAKELDDANTLITSLLDVQPKSFAYPCGQTFVGRGAETRSYVPLVAKRFLTGRKWLNEDSNDPWFCDMAQLLAMEADNKSFEQLLDLIQKVKEEGRWLILAGHEMGESGFQTTYLKTLEQFCEYANNPENGIWIDTVGNVAAYILVRRKLGKE